MGDSKIVWEDELIDAAKLFQRAEQILQARARIKKFGDDRMFEFASIRILPTNSGIHIHIHGYGRLWKDSLGRLTRSAVYARNLNRAMELIDEGAKAASASKKVDLRVVTEKEVLDNATVGSDHAPDYTHPPLQGELSDE